MNLNTPPMVLARLSDGVDGVSQTLDHIRALVRQYKKFPPIRTLALQIAAPYGKQWAGQINAIFNWVRTNVNYVQDVTDIETLQTPEYTLRMGGGDCDDMVTLLASLLEAVGFHTRSVAIGFSPDDYSHVFLQVQLPDQSRWYSLDPTEPNPMGWQPEGFDLIMVRDN